jgi:hypothetical protein
MFFKLRCTIGLLIRRSGCQFSDGKVTSVRITNAKYGPKRFGDIQSIKYIPSLKRKDKVFVQYFDNRSACALRLHLATSAANVTFLIRHGCLF